MLNDTFLALKFNLQAMVRSSLFLLFLIPLLGCGQARSLDDEVKLLYRNTVPVISKTELDSAISGDSTLVIIDCREMEEFEVSHLSGARLASYAEMEPEKLDFVDSTNSIIVYCTIGYRSERIGEKLLEAGYTRVFNLYGGIMDWKNKGGTVVAGAGDTTEKVHTYNKQWSHYLEKGEKVY